MQTIDLSLPETEFQRLNGLYPATVKSSTIGERAVELVKFYFRTLDPQCQFSGPTEGIDLHIVGTQFRERVEIKGTADADIAWGKLKVSGGPCHQHLLEELPLYRVVGVYDRKPRIFVLKYSEDFEMIPEARWALKPRQAARVQDSGRTVHR